MTIYGLRTGRDEEGRKWPTGHVLEGHADGKWYMPEQGNTGPLYVEVVPRLYKDLADFERLKESKYPPVQHLKAWSREVAYLMGDASEKVFDYDIWREDMVEW